MPLTVEELTTQKAHFSTQTELFAGAGYDRLGAPEFILNGAGTLTGPALDIGTGRGITARALAVAGWTSSASTSARTISRSRPFSRTILNRRDESSSPVPMPPGCPFPMVTSDPLWPSTSCTTWTRVARS